jgi:uncharacterized delta-60 repeat protein
MPGKALSLVMAVAATAVVATAAQAAPRDIDKTFGDDGVVLKQIPGGTVAGVDAARQPDGKIVVVGRVFVSPSQDEQIVMLRYRPDGTLDPTFGGGDGVVLDDAGGSEGSAAEAVLVQPDGKIVVAAKTAIPFLGSLLVARYLQDGARDTAFGDGGTRHLPVGNDTASVPGLALQDDGSILAAGSLEGSGTGPGTSTSTPFVARLTPDGEVDETYGTGGAARLTNFQVARARGLVVQDGKAVIAGSVDASPDPSERGLMLARFDEQGVLDSSFGSGGVVFDRPIDRGIWQGNALALWNGKLLLAGTHEFSVGDVSRSYYVLARYTANGADDETFNPDVPEPGHIVTTTGSDRFAGANGLAVDPATGAATITGFADHDGARRLLIDRFDSTGVRDAAFVNSIGNGGPVLLDAGDGGETVGDAALLQPDGGLLVAGSALDMGASKFLLARFGGNPVAPTPNLAPVARIRGHHTVPRKTRVTFRGNRSYDLDGKIVKYQWRVGKGRFHNRGPVFTHRFGRTGTRTVILRVTDDDGAIDVALFRVKVRRKRG